MNEKGKVLTDSEKYFNFAHNFGRAGLLIATIILLAIPSVICTVYGIWPPFMKVLTAASGVLVLWVPMGVSEVFSYTPILGSSCYLTYLTGNIMNTRMPCTLNAMRISDVEPGTEKGDVVATIAVSSSCMVTLCALTLAVIMVGPLTPILKTPSMQIAVKYMIPSLFGGMFLGFFNKEVGGGNIITGKMWVIIPPMLIVFACIFMGFMKSGMEGLMILLMLPVTLGCARLAWKKGLLHVYKKGEEPTKKNKQAAIKE